jgi:hypothetical protein
LNIAPLDSTCRKSGSVTSYATYVAAADGASAAASVAAGFAAGGIQGGNIQSAVAGAVSGGLFFAAGSIANAVGADSIGRVGLHAVAGCAGSAAAGGSCGHGAAAAGFAEFAGPLVHTENVAFNVASSAVAGGVGSVIGGGKFANGALTGAFGYLFNNLLHVTGGQRYDSKNFFGHTGLAVEGAGMFSYGNDTGLGSDTLTYLTSQSEVRDQTVTLIPTTPQQDATALRYFVRKPGMNSVGYLDNCAVRTNEAIWLTGNQIGPEVFPSTLAGQTSAMPGAGTWFIPRGAPIPADLAQIVRQRFTPPNVP